MICVYVCVMGSERERDGRKEGGREGAGTLMSTAILIIISSCYRARQCVLVEVLMSI